VNRTVPLLPLAVLAIAALLATPSGAAPASGKAELVTPFWTGLPTSAQFTKTHEDNLGKAKTAIAGMLKVKGKRTVENTLVPYDEALRWLDASGSQASLMEYVHPDSMMRSAAEKTTQAVSAYATELSLDRRVYDALSAIDLAGADEETRHYVKKELRDMRLSGVDKDDATRAKVKALNDELVKTGQDFDRNIREDVRTIQVKPSELTGLPQDYIDRHKPGADGMVTLDINYPDYGPLMTYGSNEDVRRRMYMEYNNRAFPKNVEVLKKMIAQRNELARTLGFPTFADFTTANRMAKDAKTVRDFIDKIVAASGPAQERDFTILLKRKQQDSPGATSLKAWESGFYTEAVKRSEYDFDSQAIRPYLPYTQVVKGVLDVTSRMFNISYTPVKNAPVWHPSVECYEIKEGNRLVGRIYLDMHPRPNKYNHAAQFDIRTGIAGVQIPEAALVCNLPGDKPDDPGLCTIDDVNTMFHEFGHLLHTILAGHHRWVGTGGIRTERDFVEAPSQMLEEWMKDPKVLQTFAKHYQTGEAVPTEMVMKMRRANDFAKGLAVRRQMVYADMSLSIYDRDPAQVDLDQLAKSLVERYQKYPYVDGTHFYTSFGHLYGYSAAYYTYMWSLVIAKDMFSAFNTQDLLDPTTSMKYRRTVLEPGGSKPAADMVTDFLGRPFGFDAYARWLNEAN
jgi:thimet oligopeptidase